MHLSPSSILLADAPDLPQPQRNRRRATRVLRCLPQEPRGATRGRLPWAGPLLRAGGVEYPARPLQALRERTPSREDGRGRARTSAGGLREWVETTPLFKDSRKLVTKRKRVREREEERKVERKIERKRRGKKLWTSENDLDRKVLWCFIDSFETRECRVAPRVEEEYCDGNGFVVRGFLEGIAIFVNVSLLHELLHIKVFIYWLMWTLNTVLGKYYRSVFSIYCYSYSEWKCRGDRSRSIINNFDLFYFFVFTLFLGP